MPAERPLTVVEVAEPETEAIAAFEDVQVPPAVAQDSIVVLPAQVLAVPVMAEGIAPTVTTFTCLQPVDNA